jgi:hypothetical protein
MWFAILLTAAVVPATAATFTVTTNADSGSGSLREAITTANLTPGPHTIDFDADYTIILASTLPTIVAGTTMTITGNGWDQTVIDGGNAPGATSGVQAFVVEGTLVLDGVGLQNCYHAAEGGAVLVSGSGSFQFLNSRAEDNRSTWYGGVVYSSGTVLVQDSLITGNEAYEGGALFIDWGTTTIETTTVSQNTATSLGGGGITNHYSGNLTVRESLFQRNQAPGKYGGGLQILSSGQTLVENSTFIHNSASYGGAVSCGYYCDLTLRGVTITANSATTAGGGIDQDNGTVDLEGSIISDNTGTSGPDIAGTVNSLGYNLIEDATGATITGDTTGNLIGADPQLGLLADNGGATQTCALPKGSPAVDAGPPACGGLATDQRGTPRPLDGDDSGTSECDIGSFELDTALFRDGFESGDLTAWSSTMP